MSRSRSPQRIAEQTRIAERVQAYADEHKTTVRQISLACGWDGSHLGTVLRRLRQGADVRTETLDTIAKTMGRPTAWLKTGEMPEGVRLGDDPRWETESRKAAERYKLSDEALAAVASFRVPSAPKRLDDAVIAQLARAWADAT